MDRPKNDSAFPSSFDLGDGAKMISRGISMRDWFAGQALAGICANPNVRWTDLASLTGAIANTAYVHADAMLAEREKGEGDGQANT